MSDCHHLSLREQQTLMLERLPYVALELSVMADEIRESLRKGVHHPVTVMALERLTENFLVHGDEMFLWSHERRENEATQELADWFAYKISEEPEHE